MRRIVMLRKKMLFAFSLLLVVTGMLIALLFAITYRYSYTSMTKTYISDVTKQTTNNLEERIRSIEDIHVQLITNTVIQKWVSDVNKSQVNPYELRDISNTVERELEPYVLIGSDVISLSIVTLNEYTFSVNKVTGRGIDFGFSEEEIYAANGTSLWGLVGPYNDVCVAKAILNLNTMKPIGYINMVYEAEYFQDIVGDNSTEFSGASYVVDTKGTIMTSNHEEYIGQKFPLQVGGLKEVVIEKIEIFDREAAFYYVGTEMQNGWTLIDAISVRDFYKRTNQVFILTGAILMVILALGFVVINVLTKKIARPMQDLLESIKLFGKGDLSQRVQVSSQDEVGQIGEEYNHMADNIETLIEKVYKLEITQKQAEIDFLYMQINPHFLYNTLDTISWIAFAKGNKEVSEITIALADLLRAMVQKERFISLEEELKTVKDYLIIQEHRFGDKISTVEEIDERAYDYRVPNFLFQPLIENAIIHGIEPKIGKGKLTIRINIEGEFLHFEIVDDGVGMTKEQIAHLYKECEVDGVKQNIGLKNVYRRLVLSYGEQSRLHIDSEKGIGTTISFKVPIIRED